MKTNLLTYLLGVFVLGALGVTVVRYNQTPVKDIQGAQIGRWAYDVFLTTP